MKKVFSLVLVSIMCLSLCVPAFAKEVTTDSEVVATSNIAMAEDSVPAGPSGYTYTGVYVDYGTAKISSVTVDAAGVATSVVVSLFTGPVGSVIIPIAVTTALTWFGSTQVGSSVGGYTMVYSYSCDDPGIYPYINYYIYKDYLIDKSGESHYLQTRTAYEYALLPR